MNSQPIPSADAEGSQKECIGKHDGNQHAKVSSQGPDQQTTHGQINDQDRAYDTEQLSNSQPKALRRETSLTSTVTKSSPWLAWHHYQAARVRGSSTTSPKPKTESWWTGKH